MSIHNSEFKRQDIRRDIVLEARVFFDGSGVLSRTNNLSLGGACVTLPFPCAHYRPMKVSAIEIENIGHFLVKRRWSSDFRVGLQFNNYVTAAREIESFFTKLDSGEITLKMRPKHAFSL